MRPSLVARRLTALDALPTFPIGPATRGDPQKSAVGALDLWNLFLAGTPGCLPKNNADHSGEDATGHQCA